MTLFRTLFISTMGLFWVNITLAASLPGPLVETDWLANNQNNVVILEIRQDIKSFTKKPVYKKDKKTGKSKLIKVGGHIPGSILVNYKKLRSNKKINGRTVQKMMVSKASFEKLMQSSGVNKDSAVVIVSKGEGRNDTILSSSF